VRYFKATNATNTHAVLNWEEQPRLAPPGSRDRLKVASTWRAAVVLTKARLCEASTTGQRVVISTVVIVGEGLAHLLAAK
jgi:hypothetical protein